MLGFQTLLNCLSLKLVQLFLFLIIELNLGVLLLNIIKVFIVLYNNIETFSIGWDDFRIFILLFMENYFIEHLKLSII